MRTLRERKGRDRPVDTAAGGTGHEDREVDFSSPEGIGLPIRSGYYTSAVFNGLGGTLVLLLYAFTSSIPAAVAIIAACSVVATPLFIVGLRYAPDARWAAHVRISFGCLILGSGALFIGEPITAMSLMLLLPILSTAYLHNARIATPYSVFCVGAGGVATYFNADLAAGVPTMIAIVWVTTAAIYSQYQLRNVATVNHGLSVTDPLTGLANVRRLRTRLREEIVAARDGERPALFTLDLDDFKLVNDRFSHSVGDDVLKAVAAALSEELAPGDLLVRRGGDEFAVLCPLIGDRDPEEIRDRLARSARRARKRICPTVNPNCSVGYVIHQDGDDADALLTMGDDALHEAKLDAHPERRVRSTIAQIYDFQARRQVDRGSPVRNGVRADHMTRGSDDQAAADLRVARWAQRSLGTTTAWRQVTMMTLVIGGTLAGMAVSGLLPTLREPVAMAGVGAMLALAPLFVVASVREMSSLWVGIAVAVIGILMTTVFIAAGPERHALLDLYLLPIMIAFYFLRPRAALPFLVAGLALFGGLLAASDYPFLTARAITSTMVIAMVVGMLAKARQTTREFTQHTVDMTVVDPLTGVANLRGLRQRVADEIGRCTATGHRLALMAIDLDDFKAVNDRYNHTVGDAVIVAAANAIKNSIRPDELVARRGGDEFAAVCVFTDGGDPAEVAGTIADSVAVARARICKDITPTASIGHVFWRRGEDCDAFLARADAELHGAKASSRDGRRVERLA